MKDLSTLAILDTPDGLRELLVRYAKSARNFPPAVISDAVEWSRFQAARRVFIDTFPIVVDMSSYRVWDDMSIIADEVCCWLREHVGEGRQWEFSASSSPGEVKVDPSRRDWVWADHGHEIGFKLHGHAVDFQLRFQRGP